jgi:hypothetical protein
MKTPKQAQINAVICRGWVPFLKELARHGQTAREITAGAWISISFCAPESARRLTGSKDLPAAPLDYERSNSDSFRYEKNVDSGD